MMVYIDVRGMMYVGVVVMVVNFCREKTCYESVY